MCDNVYDQHELFSEMYMIHVNGVHQTNYSEHNCMHASMLWSYSLVTSEVYSLEVLHACTL